MVKILLIILVIGYIWGGWKFWNGFKQTNFEQSMINRLFLSALWLPLLVVNKSYRKNFQRALKGRS